MKYTKAVRKDTHLLIAVAGGTGSGKTYSAMQLATGLCDGEPFLMLDTEGRRGLHYADFFDFEHKELTPPFHPEKYLPYVIEAEDRGFKAVVIDSLSHEWEGEGGVVEMADANRSRGMKDVLSWAEPKKRHRRMVNRFLQAKTHLIFCLRARERLDLSQTDNQGRMLVLTTPPRPICERNFMYEMTCSFMMTDQRPGVPALDLPKKIHDIHRLAFPPARQVTAASGELLGVWARGDDINGPHKELWDRARKAAHEGRAVLQLFVDTQISEEEKGLLRPIAYELNGLAREADEAGQILPKEEPQNPDFEEDVPFDEVTGECLDVVVNGSDTSVGAQEAIRNLFGDRN